MLPDRVVKGSDDVRHENVPCAFRVWEAYGRMSDAHRFFLRGADISVKAGGESCEAYCARRVGIFLKQAGESAPNFRAY